MLYNFILIWNFFFAIMVILSRNSLYSIISLIFVILGSCFLLFCLEVEFLTFILLLIYIGAIAILFLFVMMMLELNKEEIKKKSLVVLSTKYLLYFICIFKLLFLVMFFNKKLSIMLNSFSYEFLNYNEDLNIFHNSLFKIDNDVILFLNIFTQKYFFFSVIGIILLFAMVGAIALCIGSSSKKNIIK